MRRPGPLLKSMHSSRSFPVISFIFLTVTLFLFIFLATPLAAQNPKQPTNGEETNTTTSEASGDGVHYLGGQLSPPGDYSQITVSDAQRQYLSASVDLSGQLPPVGDQGQQGSCVAWAAGYYYKSWQEKQAHASWDLTIQWYQFSPSFIYNQINGGQDHGSSFGGAFNLLKEKGDVDIADMPYNQNDYLTQPNSAQLEAAKPYRAADYGYFWLGGTQGSNDIETIKAWLSSGKALVMLIPVYTDFPEYGGTPSRTYYDYNDYSAYKGNHGVCICGYDDNINPSGPDPDHQGGFKMVNSWGADWNGSNAGYVYLSYDFVRSYVIEAWSMTDKEPDTPHINSLGPASGRPGDTIHIYGYNFGIMRRNARVTFGGINASVQSFTDADIAVTVPQNIPTGSVPVVVYDWEGTPSNSVTYTYNLPTVSGISPSDVNSKVTTVSAVIKGANFRSGATVKLTKSGQTSINATGVSVTSTQIICSFSISGAAKGSWNVVVTNTDGTSYTLTNGFGIWYSTYYFAEGSTGSGFEEYLCIANPNTSTVTANVTYIYSDGTPPLKTSYNIAANSRLTPFVNNEAGAGKDVSIKVTSTAFLMAERPTYFNYHGVWDGGHCVIGATAPAKTFYFAEGYTGPNFDEYICLFNPNSVDASATITFLYNGSRKDWPVTVPKNKRVTVTVRDVVGSDKDVAAKITSTYPIVAERPMYFNYGGVWSGGHCVVGATATSKTFYFAEGYTGADFAEYLCLFNPNASATTAHVTYIYADGTASKPMDYAIGANSRVTPNVNADAGAGKEVSVKVTADAAIVAERPMYFNYQGAWSGGHCVMGATATSKTFYFAEGYTGSNFREYLTLFNPNAYDATATITYIYGGTTKPQNIKVPKNKRVTVNVWDVVGADKSVAAKVTTSDYAIVVERPTYFSYTGNGTLNWTGGHCVVGLVP